MKTSFTIHGGVHAGLKPIATDVISLKVSLFHGSLHPVIIHGNNFRTSLNERYGFLRLILSTSEKPLVVMLRFHSRYFLYSAPLDSELKPVINHSLSPATRPFPFTISLRKSCLLQVMSFVGIPYFTTNSEWIHFLPNSAVIRSYSLRSCQICRRTNRFWTFPGVQSALPSQFHSRNSACGHVTPLLCNTFQIARRSYTWLVRAINTGSRRIVSIRLGKMRSTHNKLFLQFFKPIVLNFHARYSRFLPQLQSNTHRIVSFYWFCHLLLK